VTDFQVHDTALKSQSVLLSDLRACLAQALVVGVHLRLCRRFQVDMQSLTPLSVGDVVVDVVSQLERKSEEVTPGVRRGWVWAGIRHWGRGRGFGGL